MEEREKKKYFQSFCQNTTKPCDCTFFETVRILRPKKENQENQLINQRMNNQRNEKKYWWEILKNKKNNFSKETKYKI